MTITLNTKAYGPTGFAVELSPDGEVLNVSSAAAQLPETVFRLTYGDRWEDAREHFQKLANNLAFRVEAAVWLNDVLPEYKLLRRDFRKSTAATAPATGKDAPLFARRAAFWLQHPAARPALFLQKKAYKGFSVLADLLRSGQADADALQPWLFSLIDLLQDVDDRYRVYELIGLLGTPTATDYLFGELERPGRHPYATGLLNAIKELDGPENGQRILKLHPSFADDREQLRKYLKVIECLQGKEAHLVIIAILHRHAALADEVFTALKATGHPAPGAVIREKFNKEERLSFFDLIAELIDQEPAGIRVSLADMNAKVNSPVLNAAAPVTWPQMLGPNWAKLVRATGATTLFGIVANYLERDEPWLQRCALLQLDTWIDAQDRPPTIPISVEERMLRLISSRHEKVYTIVLNILEKTFNQLAQQELVVDVVLRHARTSRYRLMNVAVLKKAAQNPSLKVQQIKRMRTAFFRASAEELPSLKTLIPYLRFLEFKDQFRKLAKERKEVLTRS